MIMAVAQVAGGPGRRQIALVIGTDEVTLAVVQAVVWCRRLCESLRSGHGNVSRHLISSTSWLPAVKCLEWDWCESELGVCRACLATGQGHWRKRRGLAGLDDAVDIASRSVGRAVSGRGLGD